MIVIWLLTTSMIRDFWQTRKGFLRIKETEERLVSVKKENEDLVKKANLVSSPEYKDKLVREKLNMQRGDEVVVVLANTNYKSKTLEDKEKGLANWEKWLNTVEISLN